ncbi:unnamed protein product [Bursaphelenchus okinawaensis]|uniref:RING-type domain-containing protein n=1 Tax=Bursaphelenchus okinawaensis TaxID=465554 RepID=A0A811JTD2_9BILA|nr:unnamed protein product [Bursaphelenchus okinawaensis]CAG9082237.1 unnamed protein product [Bursaphelenchus okinawaensis]
MDIIGATWGLSEQTRHLIESGIEITFRVPGVILLELWWIKRDLDISEVTQQIIDQNPLPGYLDLMQITEFIHRRNLDHTAATVLSYSVLLLCAMLLLLPMAKLMRIYLHGLSLSLFAFSHYMSTQYIQHEMNSEPILVLDDFVKMERHGFHFLAQMMLSVVQCFLLGMESAVGRVSLAVFTIPIIARMCACPLEKLTIAHNISCSLAMFLICVYVLYNVPDLMLSAKQGCKRLRSLLAVRGVGFGFVVLWRRLRLAQLLSTFFVLMFSLKCYTMFAKGYDSIGDGFITAVAATTCSPFSLLALALTVSYISKLIARLTEVMIGADSSQHSANGNEGIAEAFTLVFLCVQAGVLGMGSEQKIFMLKLVLFVVLSALLQSLYEVLEPHLVTIGVMTTTRISQHIRCLFLAAILLVFPIAISYALLNLLPANLWLLMILSSCVMTSVRTVQTLIIYTLSVIETQYEEPYECFDDLTFACRLLTLIAELLLSISVVVYGGYVSLFHDQWSGFSVLVLMFNSYFNVYRRIVAGVQSVRARRDASIKIKGLRTAAMDELKDNRDVCAICFGEFTYSALITPCKHVFHGFCLKKWLFVRPVCPLCYTDLSQTENSESKEENRELQNQENEAIENEEAEPLM